MTTYNNAYHAIKEEIYRDLQNVCDQELHDWSMAKLGELFSRDGAAETLLAPANFMQYVRRAQLKLMVLAEKSHRDDLVELLLLKEGYE